MPTRGLPHHDQEKIARDGNYYLLCGPECSLHNPGIIFDETLYLFSIIAAAILVMLSILTGFRPLPENSFNLFRLYAPMEPWFDKSWKLGDFELVE